MGKAGLILCTFSPANTALIISALVEWGPKASLLKLKFLDLMGQAESTINKIQKKNKTVKEVDRIKIDLTMLENEWGKSMSEWEAKEIFSFILVLEISKKGKRIVVSSLKRKFYLVRSIFAEKNLPNFESNHRMLKMSLQEHIKNRIDKADRPTEDRAAPLLSPNDWLRIQKWLKDHVEGSTYNFTNKRHMAMLSISLGFSTGLRLTEIHRLRYSDINLDNKGALKLRIRRSKSNRDGRKLVWQVAPVHKAENLLCPVQNLIWYITEMKKSTRGGAYVFSDDPEGTKLTRIDNLRNYWIWGAKKSGLPSEKWPKAHSFHGAKVNLARALGYTDEAIVDSMNWQSTSVLQEYLRNKNLKEDGVAYELTNMTANDLTAKTSHLW